VRGTRVKFKGTCTDEGGLDPCFPPCKHLEFSKI